MSNTNSHSQASSQPTELADSFSLEGKKLIGRRGQYAVDTQIQTQLGVRIYAGTDLGDNTPVVIKEYFSARWTASDMQQMKSELKQLETVDFRSGGVQDFRLLTPQDVFASARDRRCYLISRSLHPLARSLKQQLEIHGSFSATAVRFLLSQVLQSLWFLHGQSLEFASGETQTGTAHGNLTLDSILILESMPWNPHYPQFQVYLQDLELWEAVARRATLPLAWRDFNDEKQQDLEALGTIAVQLLLGEPDLPEDWNPFDQASWQDIPDQPLKQFIQQLSGLEAPGFSSAKAARARLLSLPVQAVPAPTPIQANESISTETDSDADRPPLFFKVAFALTLSALILNLGFVWVKGDLFKSPKPNTTKQMEQKK